MVDIHRHLPLTRCWSPRPWRMGSLPSPQTGGFKRSKLIVSQFWGPEVRGHYVSGVGASGEFSGKVLGLSPGLVDGHLPIAFPLYVDTCTRVCQISSFYIRAGSGPTLMAPFNFIISLKSLSPNGYIWRCRKGEDCSS